jgi:hypothetical protein
MLYLNYYRCTCGKRWIDLWNCMCNDRCPECRKEIEPYRSDDVSEEDADIQSHVS